MVKIKYLLILILFVNCSKEKYIVTPYFKGTIYSKTDNKPINQVGFFVSKFAVNRLIDTVKTDSNGVFFYDGFTVDNFGAYRSFSRGVQQSLFIKKGNIYKYIDLKKYYCGDYYKKDTIDLGIIYFENLKSIEKDSILE